MYNGIILYSFFIFWVGGCLSVLVDFDHIWAIFRRKPSFKFSDSFGRPFHTRTVFTFIACIAGFFVVAFTTRFYRGILQGIGEREALLFLIILLIITGLITKKVGHRFGKRLDAQRKVWMKEKIENDLGMS